MFGHVYRYGEEFAFSWTHHAPFMNVVCNHCKDAQICEIANEV